MRERTNYGAVADQIDYARLDKKLEQLQDQKPPRKQKSAGDVLAPLRDKLLGLHSKGWTYAQLAEELKSAGLPVKVGTLREYLSRGERGANSTPKRRSPKRRTSPATTADR